MEIFARRLKELRKEKNYPRKSSVHYFVKRERV